MKTLTKFKHTEDGGFIIHLERLWLITNDRENDGYTPRPVPNKFFKYVFIGKVQEYLSTDYNIIDLKNQYLIPNKLKSKYQYAIQLTYPYLGSDDNKLGKDVISLYFIDNKSEVVHYKRIWEEL